MEDAEIQLEKVLKSEVAKKIEDLKNEVWEDCS